MSEDRSGAPERAKDALNAWLAEQNGMRETGTNRPEDTYCVACDVFGHEEGSMVCTLNLARRAWELHVGERRGHEAACEGCRVGKCSERERLFAAYMKALETKWQGDP